MPRRPVAETSASLRAPASPAPAAREPDAANDRIPFTLRDAALAQRISLERWREVFELEDYPDDLGPDSLTDETLAAAVRDDRLPASLADLLQLVQDLDSDEGVDRVLECARTLHVPSTDWSRDDSTADQLAFLWIRSRTNDKLAEVLALAQSSMLAHLAPRPQHEFAGARDIALKLTPGRKHQFELLIAQQFEQAGLGRYLDVRWIPGRDALLVYVLRATRPRSLVAVTHDELGRERLTRRLVLCDILRYEHETNRLAITTRSAKLVPAYARLVGQALLGDPGFFEVNGTCTLAPLQARKRDALRAPAMDAIIHSVHLRRLVWEVAPGDRMVFTGNDCFKSIDAQVRSFTEGRVLEARLEIVLHGRAANRVLVTIKEPNRIEVSQERFRNVVMRYLREIGVRATPTGAGDLWSLGTEPHGTARWRRILGEDFEVVRRQGVIEQVALAHVVDGDPSTAEGALAIDHELDGIAAGHVAVGFEADTAPRIVERNELVGYRVVPAQLASQLAAHLELTAVAGAPLPDGVLDLGEREWGPQRVRVFLALKEPQLPAAQWAAALARTAASASPVAIVPLARSVEVSVPVVELRSWVAPFSDMRRDIIRKLDLWNAVDPRERAGHDAVLIVGREPHQVWFDGHHVDLTPQLYGFIYETARATRLQEARCSKELATRLMPRGKKAIDSTTRQLFFRAKQALVASCTGANRPPRFDPAMAIQLRAQRQGYAVCAPFHVDLD